MSGDAVIDVEGLTKRFGDSTAVDGFSADAGSGVCLGFDIRRESDRIKERVGYMTQHFSLYAELTVRENLEFMARLHQVRRPRDAVIRAMEDFDLGPRSSQFAGQLSGGWKQRLARRSTLPTCCCSTNRRRA